MKSFMTYILPNALLLMISVNSVSAGEITIDQKDKQFSQNGKIVEKLSINVGDKIHFRNLDPWFHNVFSLSEISTFDLGSYPKGKSKSVTFDKKGMSEIECAIHPHMYLEVEVK